MVERRDEAGVSTVLAPALLAVLLLVGAALGVVAAMVHAHRKAQAAADLSSLAAAWAVSDPGGGEPCVAAARIAAANAARLDVCQVDGRTVLVEVTVDGPHWLGQTEDLSARARAGPR